MPSNLRASAESATAMRLLRLTIDDFGLIAHAVVEFATGLTVLSGETGSGKTMLLGALRFALGERTESDMIRGGAARARVVLEIEPDEPLRGRLAQSGFGLADDDDLIITREMSSNGRSQARINGVAASASQLRNVAVWLVDVVGQHDAQRLTAPAFALETVDRFGGAEIGRAVADVRAVYDELAAIRSELDQLGADDGQRLARIEFARFAAAEIDRAAIESHEDERLRDRREILVNAERIATVLGAAGAAFEDEGGAVDTLGIAAAALAGIARFGAPFAALAEAAGALQSDVLELAARVTREREAVEADPLELETVAARLDTLERLKKKYGGSLSAILATRTEFAALIERDATRDTRTAELERQAELLARRLDDRAAILSAKRRATADRLACLVAVELGALAMPTARFSVLLEPLARIGPAGAERAEFRLAPNPGEPERSIGRSASGGELSRVLLALIVVVADRRERTTLVFDEVDAGIGGATALAVGTRIGRLASETQVVVITHLAQIASWAQAHYALRKHDVRGATVIELETLGGPQARLEEIARMLSGEANTISLEHAATLVAGTHAK